MTTFNKTNEYRIMESTKGIFIERKYILEEKRWFKRRSEECWWHVDEEGYSVPWFSNIIPSYYGSIEEALNKLEVFKKFNDVGGVIQRFP